MVLQKENQAKLKGASTTAGILWENGKTENLQNGLEQLAFAFNFEHILILDKNQKVLASSKPILEPEIEPELSGKKRSPVIHKIPIFDPRTQNEVFVMIRTKGDYLSALEKISKLDAIFRGGGVLLALFLGLVLINAILKPYRMMRKKAENVPMKPEKDGENVDFVVNVFSNTIDELRKKEKLLKELLQGSERKAEKLAYFNQYILKSISNGVIICDMKGKVLRFNSAACRILGFVSTDVREKKYQDIFSENTLLFKLLEEILKEEKAHSGIEVEFVREDGENKWLGVSSSFIQDDKGDKLGVVLFFTDLSDFKRLQKEMAFREKLASLGEMSAGLAHELRNSMSTIWGFGKLLKKSLESNHPMTDVVEMIVNESHMMEEMLQRFLAFAKPIQLVPKQFDIKDILQESLGAVKETLKSVKVKLEVKEEMLGISGDPLLLKQCFQNLFQNSIDAMPRGGDLSINVKKLIESKEQKDFILVEISDTGEGIPQDELEKIFLPFHSSREKGTGLGLSLVNKIIDLHQGKIEVESNPDIGTIFRIFLPLKLEKVPTEVLSS
jgi:PAS domain S-box-containing protein